MRFSIQKRALVKMIKAVYKDHCPPDPAEALEVMNLWREMRLRSK